jgi:Mrp family chromosome partitioning ATPase/capsular polysaccharide biosynthesis protein
MNETTDASAMFAPIWRRKWLILAVGVLVAVGTYFYYKHQRPSYQAQTQVYLGAGAEEQVSVNGTSGSRKSSQLEPSAQAVLINSPIIKSVVRQQLRGMPKSRAVRTALAGKVKTKATEKNPFVTITTEARSAAGAALLANLTAQAYVTRQNGKYHRAVESAIGLTRRQMRRIEASEENRAAEAASAAAKAKGKTPSTQSTKGSSSASVALQLANLASKVSQLETNLGVVNVRQVNPVKPKGVKQLSASPKRNAIFGFLVGLLLASFAAYALARLDNRLRSLAEIEEAFGKEILTALPTVRRPIVSEDEQPRPSRLLREPLERLHSSLQFGGAQRPDGHGKPRTILFLSANGGDGQSTVLAGLALVQRDAGQTSTVVEADLRHPTLARLLNVEDKPGLPAALEGALSLREALQPVGAQPPPSAPENGGGSPVATVLHAQATGSAWALVGGAVANPSALLASPAMGETLRALSEGSDSVLVDAPPPLEVSDAMPLLHLVDGIIIVARVGQTRESSARRLVQLLARTPSALVLGVVANGASPKEIEKYGFSTHSGRSWLSRFA